LSAEANLIERPAGPAGSEPEVFWIRSSRGLRFIDLREVWAHRDLALLFAWRDVKVRYKQTLIGIVWVLIQPILQAALFTIIFGRIAGFTSEGLPYSLFVFSGMVPWLYFSSSIAKMAISLDGNMALITKVYFPRSILPVSAMVGTLVDLFFALVVLLGLTIGFSVSLSFNLLLLPLVFLHLLAVTLGAGLWLAALNARFRDVGIVLPFVTQMLFFLTPVVFTSSVVAAIFGEESWVFPLWALNPMLGVLEAFRWAAFGLEELSIINVVVSVVVTLFLLVTGSFFFAHSERTLVDRI
jgi:lipopolysaccharide transport system permease protein